MLSQDIDENFITFNYDKNKQMELLGNIEVYKLEL